MGSKYGVGDGLPGRASHLLIVWYPLSLPKPPQSHPAPSASGSGKNGQIWISVQGPEERGL